jgi:F-type H+-transporting ATPase subunit b
MINQQIFLILSEETAKGGLFDIGATLPLVAIQFLLLMFILNIILYNPILIVVDERNEYVLDNLSKTSDMVLAATELTAQYEQELLNTKKEAKTEISKLQKIQKERFDNELKISQTYLDQLVQKVLESFSNKKSQVLINLQTEIDILSTQMLSKLSIKI